MKSLQRHSHTWVQSCLRASLRDTGGDGNQVSHDIADSRNGHEDAFLCAEPL